MALSHSPSSRSRLSFFRSEFRVLINIANLNAYGRDSDVRRDDCFRLIGEAVQYNFVGCLGLTIALQIPRGGHVLLDLVFYKESSDLLVNEL
ncbi:unnamed protein product [Prunus armeniaca]